MSEEEFALFYRKFFEADGVGGFAAWLPRELFSVSRDEAGGRG